MAIFWQIPTIIKCKKKKYKSETIFFTKSILKLPGLVVFPQWTLAVSNVSSIYKLVLDLSQSAK